MGTRTKAHSSDRNQMVRNAFENKFLIDVVQFGRHEESCTRAKG